MKHLKKILTYVEAIQKFFIFIFLAFSIYKITHFFADIPSLFNKFSLIDLKDYDKPLFDETDLKIDSKKTEEIKVVLGDRDEVKLNKSVLTSDQPDQNKFYKILKITGFVVGAGIIIFGFMYCLNRLGTNVDTIADVAHKAFDALDKNEELLKEKQTTLIKEIPKIKLKNFYIPPRRK